MSIRELLNRSLEEIRQSLFDRINEKQAEYSAQGWLPIRLNLNKGIVRGLIELWAWGLFQLYQFLAVVLKQAFADTATGFWLELHCKQVNVYRKGATKARHLLYFVRADSVGNVPIPAGRIVKTKPDGLGRVYRFVTLEAVVLADGLTEIAVNAEAEDYGQAGNVTVGQICEIATSIDGIDAVENRVNSLLIEGADKELDGPLFDRYTLAWQQLSGCTKHAYRAWAMEVTGVVAAKIIDNHPRGQGTIDVVLKGTAGAPTQSLIDAVDAAINGTGADDELRPINDDVLVKGPVLVPVDLDAELVLTHGDAAAILAEAEIRYRALFEADATVTDVATLKIGQDLPLDLQRHIYMAIDGVKQIHFTTPAADVAVVDDGLAVLQDFNLTFSWAAEE